MEKVSVWTGKRKNALFGQVLIWLAYQAVWHFLILVSLFMLGTLWGLGLIVAALIIAINLKYSGWLDEINARLLIVIAQFFQRVINIIALITAVLMVVF